MVLSWYPPRVARLGRVTSDQHRDGDAIEVADLSVAMCTRNGAPFVAEQVRSILMQSIVPRELVVGDDASTDDTIAIIEKAVAAARAERPGLPTELHVHRRPEPLGVTANFEATIASCMGALVALSDHDDVWPDGRLARLLPVFDDPAVDLVHTDARIVDARGVATGTLLLEAIEASDAEREALRAGDAFDVLLRRNLVTGATVILRRSLAEAAMPFPSSWVHDEWLAAVASATGSVRLIDEPWLDYRQHGANEIGASAPTWSRRWAKLREPRAPRAAQLIARSGALVEYLERTHASPHLAETARAKLEHERWRSELPRWQPLRLPFVIGSAMAGRYARFTRGTIDVVRDLVQPA
jgi:glycosyltransferase involved in cell wall biosynthesis